MTTIRKRASHGLIGALAFIWCAPGPSDARQVGDLPLPKYAQQYDAIQQNFERILLPIGPLSRNNVPAHEIEGNSTRLVWHIPSEALTPEQVLAPMRKHLQEQGYSIRLDCQDRVCGGFDFLDVIDILPPPHILVNLRSFHIVTALKTVESQERAVQLFASRVGSLIYLQLTAVLTADIEQTQHTEIATPTIGEQKTDIGASLERDGALELTGLSFPPGKSELETANVPSLSGLASFLSNNPKRRIALVGHSDNVGSFDGNLVLSRARALAVAAALIQVYNVASNQIETHGIGYLAPQTTNATDEGRQKNRRVMAVLLSP